MHIYMCVLRLWWFTGWIFVMMKVIKGKTDIQIEEKKKKRNKEQNVDVETHATVNNDGIEIINVLCFCYSVLFALCWTFFENLVVSVDHGMEVLKRKKAKVSINQKRKNKDKSVVGTQRQEDEDVDLEEQNGELMVMVWHLYCEQDILLSISRV